MGHQRLCAVVPGADRDVFLIQYGAEIVRVNPAHRETYDSGAVGGAEQRHIVHSVKRLAQMPDERAFVRVDAREPYAFDVIAGRGEADGLDDRGRAGLETLGRRGVSRALEGDLLDHRAAALP